MSNEIPESIHPTARSQYPIQPSRSAFLIWSLILGTACLTAIVYKATGCTVAMPDLNWQILASLFVFLAIAIFYRAVRPDPWISAATETGAQMVLIAGLFTLLNFAIAAACAPFPYRDEWLANWDRSLGLNWQGYIAFFDGRPSLRPLLELSYLSINVSYVSVLFILLAARRRQHIDRFILALWTTLALTMAIFCFMPAMGAYAYYKISPADLHSLRPIYVLNQVYPLLNHMRQPGLHKVDLSHLDGLVDFPSFHAAAAVIFTWAIWPVRPLFWLMGIMNFAMLLSTPVEGAHYFVDVLAGIGVAAAAILISYRIEPTK